MLLFSATLSSGYVPWHPTTPRPSLVAPRAQVYGSGKELKRQGKEKESKRKQSENGNKNKNKNKKIK